jgi:hypothetical protein
LCLGKGIGVVKRSACILKRARLRRKTCWDLHTIDACFPRVAQFVVEAPHIAARDDRTQDRLHLSRRHISVQGRSSRYDFLSGHPLAHSSVTCDDHSTHHTRFQNAAQCMAPAVHFNFLISSSMWYIASLALARSSSSSSHNGPPRRLDWREVRVSQHRRGMVRKQCDDSNAIDNSALPRLGDMRTKSLARRFPQ